ncbi:hypothetical protein D5086_017994 [Populus alba]|uniref:Uncharacterized protein n=1 Tax=Populus alba TaxID=43335 RepID=A0ACC4BNT5_POPAL
MQICTFYQKGICVYGSRCRYDHVKPSRPESTASSSLTVLASTSVSLALPARTVSSGVRTVLTVPPELSASSRPFIAPTTPAWDLESVQHDFLEDGDGEVIQPRNVKPADRSLCSFAAAGSCPRGDKCPHIHAERKFGLLSECNHPFCISCIRNWRGSSPTSGMDVNSSLRACPICRKLSYFVIPSVIWYSTKEEKQEIVDTYKEKLRSIDCKHFDFGNGNCPFGTSCFYKHAYRDGRLEEVVLRHLGAEDGQGVIAKNIRLSDFLGSLQIR